MRRKFNVGRVLTLNTLPAWTATRAAASTASGAARIFLDAELAAAAATTT